MWWAGGGARPAQRPGGAVAVTTQKPVFVLTGQKYGQHQKNQRVEISLYKVFVSTLDLLPIQSVFLLLPSPPIVLLLRDQKIGGGGS